MRIISEQLIASAIDNPDLRKAVCIMDNSREARALMNESPPPVLEVLRDGNFQAISGGEPRFARCGFYEGVLEKCRIH